MNTSKSIVKVISELKLAGWTYICSVAVAETNNTLSYGLKFKKDGKVFYYNKDTAVLMPQFTAAGMAKCCLPIFNKD